MEKKCIICGTDVNVEREIFLKGDRIDRVYDLCSYHWTQVYRQCLNDLLDEDEYKILNYIKMTVDKTICDYLSEGFIEDIQTRLGKGLDEIEDLSELDVDHYKIIKCIEE